MSSALETVASVEPAAARALHQRLGDAVQSTADFRGDLSVTVDRRAWVEAATLLRDDPDLDFKLFLDLCGVDYLDWEDRERYEVVLHLYSLSGGARVRLKTRLSEEDPATLGASATVGGLCHAAERPIR